MRLSALVADAGLQSRMGASARADALARYTTDAQSPSTVQIFRQLHEHAAVLSSLAGPPG